MSLLLQILLAFGTLSLLAIGGANAVLPEMHRLLVEVHGWMDDATFSQLFALAQAAPGPNILAASVMGWHIAGPAGLAAATIGMLLPAALLAWAVAGLTHRLSGAAWLKPAQFGLVPVAVGLIAASGVIMAGAAGTGWLSWAIIGVSTLFVWRTSLSPLWVLAGGGALGLLLL
ncbi:chromate transporter [Rubritepida flocculans]|uniref:chromate transporter n=1 Tax=Rubritepida flocculans TaxID=182403 RepID=UPI0003F4D0C6|nr:chromate transporter [Rubritepida flocculans]